MLGQRWPSIDPILEYLICEIPAADPLRKSVYNGEKVNRKFLDLSTGIIIRVVYVDQHGHGLHRAVPTNMIHLPNAGLMLGRRRRRRANINPALGQCVVFSLIYPRSPQLLLKTNPSYPNRCPHTYQHAPASERGRNDWSPPTILAQPYAGDWRVPRKIYLV